MRGSGVQLSMSGLMLCAAVALIPDCSTAQTPAYPVRPVRFIVPSTPAGPNDVLTRLIAERLTPVLGQQIIVDNRAGAGGRIALEIASKAAPDGYTFFLGSQAHLTVHPVLYRLPYDIAQDFAPVVLVGRVRYLLLAHPSVPAGTLKDLLNLLRSRPGKLNYASVGAGTTSHIVGELFKKVARVDIVHVPYKVAGPAYTDLISGQVQLMFASPLAVSQYIRTGQLKAIAIAAPRRSGLFPEIRTFEEAGLPDFEGSAWWAVMTRAGVPSQIVTRLNGEINRILRSPQLKERLAVLDVEPVGGSPGELATYLNSERAKWAKVIKDAGIVVE